MHNFQQGSKSNAIRSKIKNVSLRSELKQSSTSSRFSINNRIVQKQILPGKQSPSLYQYLERKVNDNSLHNLHPFSARSASNMHFYNLEKKLSNLEEVLSILQELYGQETYELKDEIEEILMYQSELKNRYESYEQKLVKLIEIQKQCKLKTTKKASQYLELSKQSRKKPASKAQVTTEMMQSSYQNQYDNETMAYCCDQNVIPQQQISNQLPTESTFSTINENDTQFNDSHIIQEQIMLNNVNQVQPFSNFTELTQQIKLKQDQRDLLNEKIKDGQVQIEQSRITQETLVQCIKTMWQQKQSHLQQIGQIQKNKLQIQDQNTKLQLTLQNQKLSNSIINQNLNEQHYLAKCIETPIPTLYLMKKSFNNQLQELRGSIRVYCRIRPITQKEILMTYQIKSHNLLYIKKSLNAHKSENIKTEYEFDFDQIFDQQTSQQQVFSQISQLIQTAIDGFNVCIFAYGQTGSGKTFTMQGNNSKGKQSLGLIPRSTELIFAEIQKYRENGWEVELDVSINEIYNDQAVNLLVKSEVKMQKPQFKSIKTIDQVEQLFDKAISNRSTAFTLSNADSSRSHLIFIIRIRSRQLINNQQKPKQRQSHLVLVDLAGSERVKESGVSNQRLKQAQHINLSLSQLGQVIRSLKSNKGKTNFRNSKLTHFLEPYLQKGSKAIMFVNISPASSDDSQSINSLKFASTAKECRFQAD